MANEVVKKNVKETFASYLQDVALPRIAAVAAKHITPDRMVKIACMAASRNPLLYDCTPMSVAMSLCQAAEMGLEVGGGDGHAYLVPFKNRKNNTMEATLIVGYQGMIELILRAEQCSTVEARVVHEKDTFEYEFGSDARLKHVPTGSDDPGEVKAAYAIATMKDGHKQWVILFRRDLELARDQSRAGDFGPWKTHTEAMQAKTAVRRLAKFLRKSKELARALEIEDAAESGQPLQDADFEVFDTPGGGAGDAVEKTRNGVKNKLASKTHKRDVDPETGEEVPTKEELAAGRERDPGEEG